MKCTLFLLLIISSTASWAGPKDQFMSVKERLRLSLWIEGIQEEKGEQQAVKKNVLPEELERALKKI